MADNKIDIKENYIRDLDEELLSLLLVDRTSKKNIIWATDDYKSRGKGFRSQDQITFERITGYFGNLIKPRIEKSKAEIQNRIKNKAEVFTPSWICNAQNNLADESWFGYKFAFNIEKEKGWIPNAEKVAFPTTDGKTWQDYVQSNRLEVSCGEAPYIVSRYDTVSGEIIPINSRIGLLDRKLRVVNENIDEKTDWLNWTKAAYKSVFAYDWQGDNVLIARENLLFTFIDNYIVKFNEKPTTETLKEIAEIITWNVWQMDGLKFVIPNSCVKTEVGPVQFSLFVEDNIIKKQECAGCVKNNINKHTGIYCKIKNWDTNRTIKFISLMKGN